MRIGIQSTDGINWYPVVVNEFGFTRIPELGTFTELSSLAAAVIEWCGGEIQIANTSVRDHSTQLRRRPKN